MLQGGEGEPSWRACTLSLVRVSGLRCVRCRSEGLQPSPNGRTQHGLALPGTFGLRSTYSAFSSSRLVGRSKPATWPVAAATPRRRLVLSLAPDALESVVTASSVSPAAVNLARDTGHVWTRYGHGIPFIITAPSAPSWSTSLAMFNLSCRCRTSSSSRPSEPDSNSGPASCSPSRRRRKVHTRLSRMVGKSSRSARRSSRSPTISFSEEWCRHRDRLRAAGARSEGTHGSIKIASRAGTNTVWWTGNEKEAIGTEEAGNLADAWVKNVYPGVVWRIEEWLEDAWVVHAPVGSFRPNGFGLHDTIGNVAEWCRDEWGGYDVDVDAGDGRRKASDPRSRVNRGGSYLSSAAYARSARRKRTTPQARHMYIGVRPARIITE